MQKRIDRYPWEVYSIHRYPGGVYSEERVCFAGGKDNVNNMGESKDIGTEEKECVCGCQQKSTPRRPEDLKALKNRLNRMQGQLSGIGRMLDENRYCGDILVQIAAVESALQAFGHMVLKEHMETCVQEKIREGDKEVIAETLELIKKLR